MEREDPILANDLMENADPNDVSPATDILLPNLAIDRTLIEEDKLAPARIEVVAVTRNLWATALPIDIDEPRRAKPLTESELPIRVLLMILTSLPNRANDLSEKELAIIVAPTTEVM
jgi:hypothetical protein